MAASVCPYAKHLRAHEIPGTFGGQSPDLPLPARGQEVRSIALAKACAAERDRPGADRDRPPLSCGGKALIRLLVKWHASGATRVARISSSPRIRAVVPVLTSSPP